MKIETLGIVGAGAMGRGIAQIAAQAGLRVRPHDSQPQATSAAHAALRESFDKLVAKSKMFAAGASEALDRVVACTRLDELGACDLVIEAIVERRDAKRALFVRLEGIVRSAALLASNTSSLSITAIAVACRLPERVAGDIDRALQLGLGYPMGPLAMGDALGPAVLLRVLRNLLALTGDPRYRPSPWLARRAQLGLLLLTDER